MVLALVHKNSSLGGSLVEEGARDGDGVYVGLGGVGDYGRCVTELKRRCVFCVCAQLCLCVALSVCVCVCVCSKDGLFRSWK